MESKSPRFFALWFAIIIASTGTLAPRTLTISLNGCFPENRSRKGVLNYPQGRILVMIFQMKVQPRSFLLPLPFLFISLRWRSLFSINFLGTPLCPTDPHKFLLQDIDVRFCYDLCPLPTFFCRHLPRTIKRMLRNNHDQNRTDRLDERKASKKSTGFYEQITSSCVETPKYSYHSGRLSVSLAGFAG